ncbi:hypothetical protein NE236_19010 [Actinoallomurus purpureus]|uniref:hypothetical protein n=1 Tax=Actinoallomurus purpureus TaxID=478114 RepID=UPI0020933FD8|nr:hypothetical protein [Actinoallomurus purpureus]MCO6007076.1 hypothetical protein [Actinoallomurus purpureus]
MSFERDLAALRLVLNNVSVVGHPPRVRDEEMRRLEALDADAAQRIRNEVEDTR